MRKIFLLLFLTIFSVNLTSALDIEDTSIIDSLNQEKLKELDIDLNLKSFESCENFEDVIGKYVKTYWENNKSRWYGYPVLYKSIDGGMNVDFEADMVTSNIETEEASGMGGSEDFSETNTQVKGVDESDIVKTDGKYIYYYNNSDKYVYIVEAKNLKIIKKIKLPNNFYNPVLYIGNDRLTIVSSGYSDIDYSKSFYMINRNSKTYTIVFDTSDIEKPVLSKLYVADGDLKQSRKIGDYVYVISNNNFSIPYYRFEKIDDIEIEAGSLMPKKIDISKVDNISEQNLELKGKKLPYNISAGNIAKCSDIEYVLPDEETLENFDFSPSYNIVSIIDTNDTTKEVKTKVIAGSNSEIYMSLDNLYLTSNIYTGYDYKCSGNFRCIMPYYYRGQQTLIHQVSVDGQNLKYNNSTIIPGSPLNQYSMDQYADNFRIITSINYPERSTGLYVLDKDNLELKTFLDGIEPGEEFKSSRFIGDKLFLVTFKQVDPLFVIDVSNNETPKILGELKIPGYSTYLHPYDENHLIGIGYNTTENKWGGTVNDGIKVDLYKINYDKKCGDLDLSLDESKKCESGDYKGIIVEQKYSKTFGELGSSSEALTNPRMFMWKADDKKLLLPVTLFYNDKDDMYRHIDYFQGLLSLTIDKDKGINQDYMFSHIDTSNLEKDRQEACLEYSGENIEKKCYELIGGGEYCEDTKYRYVPKYCYADSTIGEYISLQSWKYSNSFIKRAIWIGNNVFTISDDMIRSSNIYTGIKTGNINLNK